MALTNNAKYGLSPNLLKTKIVKIKIHGLSPNLLKTKIVKIKIPQQEKKGPV